MMKIHKYKRYYFAFSLLLLFSCNKSFLDPTNPSAVPAEDVWKDASLVNAYINGLYKNAPGWDYNLYNNITDEARSNYPGNDPNNVLAGSWDQTKDPMDVWNDTYTYIRRINEVFVNIEKSPLVDSTMKQYKGQAYFLRALQYFQLVERYGAVPLITTPQSLKDSLLLPRNTLAESFAFIVKDLDSAFANLPLKPTVRGRVSKYAATALKGRVLLFQASPLYNTTNTLDYWHQSAVASLAVINSGLFSLYPNIRGIWLEVGANPESLFEVQYQLPAMSHGLDAQVKPLRLANNDAGQCSPLQNLVDAFPMSNGKLITDPTSGYDANNPYVGRDNRFYADIAYNGATMYGTTSGPPVHQITLEIYKGGQDYDADPTTVIYNTITGYYRVKAVDSSNTVYTYQYGSVQPWIELRYAEVLLNYAEAQNEYSGPDATVYNALNLIRRRAGITVDLVSGSLSQSQMRDLIKNERFVELCFENKRYWDLRRWKTAASVLNGKKGRGVFITKNANGTFSYAYQDVDPTPMVFSDKMYLLPIPQTERVKNPNLTQNPGWTQ